MEVDLRTLALQNRRVSIRMEQMADRMLAGTGLTAAQGNVLCFILEHGREGTSLTDIHREFGFSKATLLSLIHIWALGAPGRGGGRTADHPGGGLRYPGYF